MVSERFRCPHCGVSLTKSPMAHILGQAHSYVVFSSRRTVTCPGCGGAIDAKRMIDGEYDEKEPVSSGCGILVAIAVIVAILAWIFG